MNRMVCAIAAALLGCCANTARAESLPLFVGLPGTYTPGAAFTFEVRVPQLADFSGYNVELIFDTGVVNPPLFVSAAAPGTGYVFPSTATFQSGSTRIVDSTQVFLTFRDSTDPAALALPGVNDVLAVVTVQPGAGFTGPITISYNDAVSYVLHNGEDPIYENPEAVLVRSDDTGPGPTPVPAPAGALLLGVGGLLLGARNRVVRRVSA